MHQFISSFGTILVLFKEKNFDMLYCNTIDFIVLILIIFKKIFLSVINFSKN